MNVFMVFLMIAFLSMAYYLGSPGMKTVDQELTEEKGLAETQVEILVAKQQAAVAYYIDIFSGCGYF